MEQALAYVCCSPNEGRAKVQKYCREISFSLSEKTPKKKFLLEWIKLEGRNHYEKKYF